MILVLDPSSTATGYALFDHMRVEEAGVLRGHSSDKALARTCTMATEVMALVTDRPVETVVVEMPSGGPGTGSRNAAGPRLITYGVAAGFIYGRLYQARRAMGYELEPVIVEDWTRGWKKRTRQAAVMAMFPEYRPEADRGLDCADALALGWWWQAGKKQPGA